MRIDQVITLVWIGNVVLTGGAGWAGWQFLQQKKAQAVREKIEWPAAKSESLPDTGPGKLDAYQRLWTDPLSGLVPPPPEKEKPVAPVQVDPATAFRSRVQLVGGMAGGVTSTVPCVTVDGAQRFVPLGAVIDGFQLRGFTVNVESGIGRAEFWSSKTDKNPVVIEQQVLPNNPFASKGAKPFTRQSGDPAIHEGTVLRDVVEAQAFPDAKSGEWIVPADEADWWAEWGSEEVLRKTSFAPRPQGLEIASEIPRGPLNGTRGLDRGDIILSINDVAVKSLEDVFSYIRGEGRGLTRFVVVFERAGARKTVVYRVARRGR